MASPVVEATAESSTNTAGANHVVTLPAGIVAGELILVCMDIGSVAATLNAHADYTELLDENAANGLKILYRYATGGEGNPTFVSSASTRDATITFRISGTENPATQAPEIATTSSGSSITPDPPAITPTGGSKDYLFLAMLGRGGEEADDDTWATASPAGYTPDPPLQKACGIAGTNLGGIVAAASRQATAASENPGTFTIATGAWRAQTIAVHPRPAQTFTATVAVGATGAIASAATFFSILERITSLAAVSGIASAGIGQSAGPTTFERAAAVGATTGIASSASSILARSAALSSTTAVTSVPQRDLVRSAALSATTGLTTTSMRALVRTAALSASSGIASAADIQGIASRSAALTATATLTASGVVVGPNVVTAASALSALTAIATGSQRDVLRSVAITASVTLTAGGGVPSVQWVSSAEERWYSPPETQWLTESE